MDFIAFVARGSNNRTDFHINPGDEIFYQLEGVLSLHYRREDQKHEVAMLKEGDLFLMPGKIPHSSRRGNGSWTFVVERKRRLEEQGRFVRFCQNCNARIFETTLRFDDPSNAVKKAYEAMKANNDHRKCSQCGFVQDA